MSNYKVMDAVHNINDKYLEEAIGYQGKKRVKFKGWTMLTVAAACFCLFVGAGVRQYDYHYSVDSVVDIDINPSIELKVSKSERVLSVNALNEDGKVVLEGMQLKNAELDIAMDAIVDSLLENGYLNETYNAINVCVENADEEAGEVLGQKLKDGIMLLLDENELIGKVQMQISAADEKAEKDAEAYGVSVGKYALAKKVSESMGTQLKDAVGLSISELWDLADAECAELITKDAALEIAYTDAGIDAESAKVIKNVIQKVEDSFIYRIEFLVGENGLYKYKVDAVDGTILERIYECREEDVELPEDPEQELLSRKEILQIVYADAGVTGEDARLHKIKLEKADVVVYVVEFSIGRCEYLYRVDAVEGTVVSKEVEEIPCTVSGGDGGTPEEIDPETIITEQDALQIVLDAAGVSREDISKLSIKFKNNKVIAEYRIQFFVGEVKYEYYVDAVTGEIVKGGQENTDGKPEVGPGEKPENKPENVPEGQPENKPENVPEGQPENKPENVPEGQPENKPENVPEGQPGNRPENQPNDNPGIEPEKKPEMEGEEGGNTDDGTADDGTTNEETPEAEKPEVPGAPPMENPDGDMGRLPNENPNRQWENVPNPNPENEKPQNQDGQMNGLVEGEQIPRR